MSEREQILDIVRKFSGWVPFNRFLGLEFLDVKPGEVLMRLPFKEELIGDPTRPALHGSVIASAIDSATGAAVWSQIDLGDVCSTIDIRVDYLRPGRAEAMLVEARVLRSGRHVAVVSARAYHEGHADVTVAEGRAVFSIKRSQAVEKMMNPTKTPTGESTAEP